MPAVAPRAVAEAVTSSLCVGLERLARCSPAKGHVLNRLAACPPGPNLPRAHALADAATRSRGSGTAQSRTTGSTSASRCRAPQPRGPSTARQCAWAAAGSASAARFASRARRPAPSLRFRSTTPPSQRTPGTRSRCQTTPRISWDSATTWWAVAGCPVCTRSRRSPSSPPPQPALRPKSSPTLTLRQQAMRPGAAPRGSARGPDRASQRLGLRVLERGLLV